MLRVSLDTKPAIRIFERMDKQLDAFNSDPIAEELAEWEEEDLRHRHPAVKIEDNVQASTDLKSEQPPVVQPAQITMLRNRYAVLMNQMLNWRGITLPKRFRFRAPKGGAEWIGWEKEWIKHRTAEFKKRYGPRWRKVLYSTAYNRYKSRYSKG